jgi:hypothetical protein
LEALQSSPWELLYREDTEDFLALSRLTPVVRTFDLPRPTPRPHLSLPLRILAVLSQDSESGHLDLRRELEELTKSLKRNPSIQVDVLDSPDTQTLRTALCATPFHVLHIMGHGDFDPQTGEGVLLFRGPEGRREVISGRHLATKIKDSGSLRLAVLNACNTALANAQGEQGPFAGVATALVLGGLPAVIAMQSPIEDTHAISFSSAFYDRLADGKAVEEAVTEGRQAIHSLCPTSGDWAVPVLFLRAPSGRLFSGIEPEADFSVEEQDRPSRSPSMAKGAFLLLFLFIGIAVLYQYQFRTGSGQDDVEKTQPTLHQTLETQIKPPAPHPRKPVPPASAGRAVGRTESQPQTIQTGGLRFEVSAPECPPAVSKSLIRALNHAAQEIPPSLLSTGWTIHLDVAPPHISGYSESGTDLQSCSLSASSSVSGHGPMSDLGFIHVAGSAFESSAACDEATKKLAGAVIQNFFQLYKEGSK